MSFDELPQGLEAPIFLGGDVQQFVAWHGQTTFRRNNKEIPGEARVYLDLMPVPEFRFEFIPDTQPSLKDIFRHASLGEGVLECGPPIGAVKCHVTQTGQQYSGYIEDQQACDDGKAVHRNATFLVLNGPLVHGSPIARGKSSFAGRMYARFEDTEIIVDRLSSEKQSRRSIYQVTHVARCIFPDAVTLERIDLFANNLFRSLSLMKCRWVGLLGPWIWCEDSENPCFRVSVTNTTRNGNTISWCHESMRDCFSELVPAMFVSFSNEKRAEALQTALHWLVESEQCSGGVEGAIILQQAALECLAWLEIVVERSLCSESGFKQLPASDKIRWLFSLHNIQAVIPDKSTAIKAYAKAFNHNDLIDVLVDVRNTLVHAEPKKSSRLFARPNGSEEQGDLWYQAGGILQQAFLASIGYRGPMLRRDANAEYAVAAVKPVPWSD